MSVQNVGRNRWRVIVKTGVDPKTGKARYIDRIIRGDKQDAMNFEAQTLGRGGAASASATFGDFINRSWLPSLKVQESTKEQHVYALKHLEDLYPIKLSRLSAQDIESAIHALPPGNIRRRAKKTLSVALNAAVRWDVLPYNPLQKAQIVIGQGEERKYEAYSAAELQQALSAVRDDICEPVVIVMAFCGLRREEALALDWDDINLETGTVSVYKAWANNARTPTLKSTKTQGSKREAYVRGWGLVRLRELADKGALWKGKTEGRVAPSSASERFKKLIEQSGVRFIPLNHLRHTHATLALSSGVDVALVSKSLGHSRISTTVDAYIRPLEKAKEQAADLFAQVVGGF